MAIMDYFNAEWHVLTYNPSSCKCENEKTSFNNHQNNVIHSLTMTHPNFARILYHYFIV